MYWKYWHGFSCPLLSLMLFLLVSCIQGLCYDDALYFQRYGVYSYRGKKTTSKHLVHRGCRNGYISSAILDVHNRLVAW